jgi:hypothetical protein
LIGSDRYATIIAGLVRARLAAPPLVHGQSAAGNRGSAWAFSFSGGRLSQYHPGELPRLGHRQACPPVSLAAGALSEVHEDPGGGVPGIAQSEPADGEFPSAVRAQALMALVGADARG